MNNSITTIIPFFNCGEDLAQMLDSLLSGTIMPTEILLIDDGSTDNSCDIAKSYSKRYPFIKYFLQKHSGVSAARNLGIKHATSAWISFLDADDYVEKNFYEAMLNSLTSADLAGCVCGYFTESDGISTSYAGSYKNVINSATLQKAMFVDDNVRGFLFTRLFKAELVKNISFDTSISMCEDLLFQSTLLSANPDLKFAYVNLPLYHYVQKSSSATNNVNLFNGDIFKYKPAFDKIRVLILYNYVNDSYSSIVQFSIYRLLKNYHIRSGSTKRQVRLLQMELKNTPVSKISKRRIAFIYAPFLYRIFMK